jgi:hypothetical protein
MVSDSRSDGPLRDLCAEIGQEDGQDPRDFHRKSSRKVTNRKAIQLCSQVATTIDWMMAGECGDDLLREGRVESVIPAPNSSRLLVTVSVLPDIDREQMLRRLTGAGGLFRREIAVVVVRKHVPQLVFCVVARE